jgi:hemoglobin/transferrin/lactoferrin receptor protein
VAVSVSDVSPKIGVVYRAGAGTDLFLQYARGFRAPPFEDANIGLDIPLFNIRALPNPDLRSETSDGWEAGLRWEGRRARLALAAFQTDYDDFIETKARIGVDPESGRLLFQSRNIDRARIRGVEARGSLRPGGHLHGVTLEAAAYLAEGENRITGEPLGSVGPAQAVLGARWRSHDDRTGLRAVLTLTDGWSRQDESGGERFEPAGYGVVDVYATRLVGDHLTLTLGIGNLTDRRYWRWADVSGLTPDDPVLPMLAQPGRHYSIGLQWDW